MSVFISVKLDCLELKYIMSFGDEGRDVDGDNDNYTEHSSWKVSSPAAAGVQTRIFKTSRY